MPIAGERIVPSVEDAVAAADELGYPVVAKLNGDAIAHKTERGLVRLALGDAAAVEAAAGELLAKATPEDGPVGLLVAPMLQGNRELIAGLSTDPQFGTTVMVGIGGIFAEAIADVSVRPVPVHAVDAAEMVDDLATQALLGEFRGEPAVDREALVAVIHAPPGGGSSIPEGAGVRRPRRGGLDRRGIDPACRRPGPGHGPLGDQQEHGLEAVPGH